MHLESEIIVKKSVEQVWSFFEDPYNLAKWDRSVAKVVPTSPDPGGVGYTFDTIGPSSGGKEGLRSSYRIVEIVPNKLVRTVLTNSKMFKEAQWSMEFEPVREGTKVICTIQMSVRWSYFYLIPLLWITRGALLKDLGYLKQTLESQ